MAQSCGTSQRPSAPKEEGSSSFTGQRTALPRPRCPCRGGHGPTACHPATAGLRTARSGDSLPPALRSLSARQQPRVRSRRTGPHWAALGPGAKTARLPPDPAPGSHSGGSGISVRATRQADVRDMPAVPQPRVPGEARCRCDSHGCPRPCLSPLLRKSL